MQHRYFIINKPYKMVSQFISSHKVDLLGDLNYDFPEGIHAIGRLDNTSEGLLILTTNKKVTRLLFQGDAPHRRTYHVRVSGKVTPQELEQLRNGVTIRIDSGADYQTPPCEVDIIDEPDYVTDEQKELRRQVPHTWLSISLYEGKFRQVRKMVAAVRHQCRRLIRVSIEDLILGDLPPGAVQELNEQDFFEKLKIKFP